MKQQLKIEIFEGPKMVYSEIFESTTKNNARIRAKLTELYEKRISSVPREFFQLKKLGEIGQWNKRRMLQNALRRKNFDYSNYKPPVKISYTIEPVQ